MNLPRPHAVLLDMDGLLFDTETLYAEALVGAARAADGRDFPRDLFLRLVGRPWVDNRELLRVEWCGGDVAEVDALHEAWMAGFERLAPSRLRPRPGAPELLAAIDALGLPRAVCTSGTHEEVARNFTLCALPQPEIVVARGDYARGKPAPDPYVLAARRLGTPPAQCLAVEDSHNGVHSAAAAGTVVVMVPDLLPATEEMVALTDGRVAADLFAVRDALLRAVRG